MGMRWKPPKKTVQVLRVLIHFPAGKDLPRRIELGVIKRYTEGSESKRLKISDVLSLT